MKILLRTGRRSLHGTAIFVLTLSCISPVFAEEGSSEPSSGRPKVCVLLPTLRENRWQVDRKAFLDAARERTDMEIVVNVSRNRSDVQAAQLDKLVASRCDFYVVAAHDYRDMCRQLARYPNIHVVAYDRPLPCVPVEIFVGYDTFRIGVLQGEYLAKTAPKGTYLFLKGPQSDGNSRSYFAGAYSVLSPRIDDGSIRVIDEKEVRDWSPARAQAFVIDAWKKSKGGLAAILAPNDAIAEGVIETLKGLGAAGKVVVTGQDGEPQALARIKQGNQGMTVTKSAPKLVSATLAAVSKLAAGQRAGATSVFEFEGQKIPSILLEPEMVSFFNRTK